MTDEITREICESLKQRLQQAEDRLKRSLSATGDDHPVVEPARDLLAVHTEIRDQLLSHFGPSPADPAPEGGPEVATAELEIESEAHTLKPDFKDVVKALFMWKDDPVERVQKDG